VTRVRPRNIVAPLASAALLAVVAGHADAAKSPYLTGGAVAGNVGINPFARTFVVGTIWRPSDTRFRTEILGPNVKTMCVYSKVKKFAVKGNEGSFEAQGGCTEVSKNGQRMYRRNNRFTVVDGGTPSQDTLAAKALTVPNIGLATAFNLFQGRPYIGNFTVTAGGSTPRAQSSEPPFFVGGGWRYGPPSGSTYYIAADLQRGSRHLEVVHDSPTGFVVCTYSSLITNFKVSGKQLTGYRATFDAQGQCVGYETRPSPFGGSFFTSRARFTIVDHAGGGGLDTIAIVKLPNAIGIPELPAGKIVSGNFTVRPG
jgi:hypothetical protein